MADDRAGELRALEKVIETCRAKAVDLELPALIHILHKAGLSLSDHATRAAPPEIPRGRALSVPRGRIVRQ